MFALVLKLLITHHSLLIPIVYKKGSHYTRGMAKKNILVTGAVGFIGFHLAKYLHARGDNVIGFDNFNDYYSPELKRARERELTKLGIEVVNGDICTLKMLNATLDFNEITHIVHLAAQAGVRYSLINPQAYVKANLEGFTNVLEACKRKPEIKLTFASSSSVYGNNSKVPFSVRDRSGDPVSFYGATKKANETMAYTYHHNYGIAATGLRFFTVYGPWGRPDMAYFSFTKAILEEKPIEIYNEGKLRRDFTYIDDIVNGIAAAVDLESNWDIFNLGNSKPVELGRFIEIIEDSLGKKAKKNYVPMQPGDVLETYADISESKTKLGFEPKVTLEEGIPKFVKWYQDFFKFAHI